MDTHSIRFKSNSWLDGLLVAIFPIGSGRALWHHFIPNISIGDDISIPFDLQGFNLDELEIYALARNDQGSYLYEAEERWPISKVINFSRWFLVQDDVGLKFIGLN